MNEFNYMLSAHLVDKGGRFVLYQDGCEYETPNQKMNIDIHLKYVSEYRTFGWSIGEKVIPFRSIRLQEFNDEYTRLVREGFTRKYQALIFITTLTNHFKNRTIVKSESFFEKINRDKYPQIAIRPRPYSRKLGILNRRIDQKELKIPNDVTLTSGMGNPAGDVVLAELVVHWFMPSTNFLECIYVNHPVVVLQEGYEPTNVFKPIYEELNELGILHYTLDSMLEFLNSMDDVNSWWSATVNSEKYKAIKRLIAGGNEIIYEH
jgi:hypothetical protein